MKEYILLTYATYYLLNRIDTATRLHSNYLDIFYIVLQYSTRNVYKQLQ